MVGTRLEPLEQDNSPQEGNISDSVKCFPPGLGGSMQGILDGRAVVPSREPDAHQLSGTASCHPNCEDLLQKIRCHPAAAGQPDYSLIHQQPRGNSLLAASALAKDLRLWVLSLFQNLCQM